MRITRLALLSAVLILSAGCGDTATNPVNASSQTATVLAEGCISSDSVSALIRAVFPAGNSRSSALARWDQTVKSIASRPDRAQAHALQLVDYLLKKYFDEQLIGGKSLETRILLSDLLNGILCLVGLPPLDSSVLDIDGAAVVVEPSSPTTTIVTGTEWAGVVIPAGAVNQTTLITIRRLPDFPGPLLTPFDQYPLFYEFDYTPGTTFSVDVTVGTCLANGYTPPDPTRLRVAHNIPPFTMGSIEVLPLVAAPFVECSDAGELASLRPRWGLDLAMGGLLLDALKRFTLPSPLEAATRRGGAGVGGTVRTFSPFGLVDTLAHVVAASAIQQTGVFGSPVAEPPAVRVVTPTGRPMPDIRVYFGVFGGGGSVAPLFTATGADGVASSSSWTLGSDIANEVVGLAVAPTPGTGFAPKSVKFRATAQTAP